MDSTERFATSLKAVADIPDPQIAAVLAMAAPQRYEKGDAFVRAGDTPTRFAVVLEGLFRYYYLTDSGKEFTKGFFPEGAVLSSYSAMIQGRESYFTIEALEPSWVMAVPYAPWRERTRDEPSWQRFLIALLEKGYCVKEAREREFLLFDAEQRYRSFLETHPGLEGRLKQHHIAAYLGISPVTLSRIRKKRRP